MLFELGWFFFRLLFLLLRGVTIQQNKPNQNKTKAKTKQNKSQNKTIQKPKQNTTGQKQAQPKTCNALFRFDVRSSTSIRANGVTSTGATTCSHATTTVRWLLWIQGARACGSTQRTASTRSKWSGRMTCSGRRVTSSGRRDGTCTYPWLVDTVLFLALKLVVVDDVWVECCCEHMCKCTLLLVIRPIATMTTCTGLAFWTRW